MKGRAKFLIIAVLVGVSFGCAWFASKPSDTVKNFAGYLRDNKPEQAANLFSARFVSEQGGKDKVIEIMKGFTSFIEKQGRIPEELSFEVAEETVIADAASVKVKFIHRNGNPTERSYKLVKENGEWKIDNIPY